MYIYNVRHLHIYFLLLQKPALESVSDSRETIVDGVRALSVNVAQSSGKKWILFYSGIVMRNLNLFFFKSSPHVLYKYKL